MSTSLVTIERQNETITLRREFTEDQIELLKRTVCRGSTNDELAMFLHVAKRTGLDPFARQLYAIKRWDAKLQREVMTMQTGIDGFRVIAERSGKYEGQDGPFFCGEDGVWTDVWLKKEPPIACKIGIFKTGFRQALYRVVRWDEYVQLDKYQKPTKFWAAMPCGQLAKCCESIALRAAFPQDLSGIYTAEEMDQSENGGSKEAAQAVAEQKIRGEIPLIDAVPVDEAAELKRDIEQAETEKRSRKKKPSAKMIDILQAFGELKKRYAKAGWLTRYYDALLPYNHSDEFPETEEGLSQARAKYKFMTIEVADLEVHTPPVEEAETPWNKLPDLPAWPDNAVDPKLGKRIRVQGVCYQRTDDTADWAKAFGMAEATKPEFGKK